MNTIAHHKEDPLARPKPSLRQTRKLLNRLTLGFVSILGFFSAASILTQPNANLSAENTEQALASRQPASINFTPPQDEKKAILVVKLTCEPEMQLNENSNQIRLKGKICTDKLVSIENSSVKNSDDKVIATVFHKDKNFTTDIIHLRPGQNRLVITNKLSDGTTDTQVLVVTRSPASEKKN